MGRKYNFTGNHRFSDTTMSWQMVVIIRMLLMKLQERWIRICLQIIHLVYVTPYRWWGGAREAVLVCAGVLGPWILLFLPLLFLWRPRFPIVKKKSGNYLSDIKQGFDLPSWGLLSQRLNAKSTRTKMTMRSFPILNIQL